MHSQACKKICVQYWVCDQVGAGGASPSMDNGGASPSMDNLNAPKRQPYNMHKHTKSILGRDQPIYDQI